MRPPAVGSSSGPGESGDAERRSVPPAASEPEPTRVTPDPWLQRLPGPASRTGTAPGGNVRAAAFASPAAAATISRGNEPGLYVSRQVDPASAVRILALAKQTLSAHGVPAERMILVPPDKMHVTVVRSPNPLREELPPDLEPLDISAQTDWHLIRLGDGIALRFDAPALKARWEAARARGAGWTYDSDYVAHVTVTYDAQGAEFAPIPLKPDFALRLLGERAEPFDANWVAQQRLAPGTGSALPNAPSDET